MSDSIQLSSDAFSASDFVAPVITMEALDLLPMTSNGTQVEKIMPHDQVFALIFNEQNEALILEAPPRGHGWPEWQLVRDSLPTHEDPLPFAKRKLLELAGYESEEWIYLGSYRLNDSQETGAGHFFCARKACPVPTNEATQPVRWVNHHELRHALIDGRVSSMHFAITISLGLLLS